MRSGGRGRAGFLVKNFLVFLGVIASKTPVIGSEWQEWFDKYGVVILKGEEAKQNSKAKAATPGDEGHDANLHSPIQLFSTPVK
jgi:hypothetical protein